MSFQRRSIFIAFFACCIALYEVGMRTFFPIPYAYFFPSMGIICLGLFRRWNEEVLIFAFIVGCLHDLFSFHIGFHFVGFPLLVIFLRFVSLNVMTNRSLYSLIAMVLLGRYCFWIWETFWIWIGSIVMNNHHIYISWSELWRRSLWDILFVSLCFLIPLFIQKIFRLRRKSMDNYGSVF